MNRFANWAFMASIMIMFPTSMIVGVLLGMEGGIAAGLPAALGVFLLGAVLFAVVDNYYTVRPTKDS